MSNAAVVVPQCTHIKNNGEVCGSPAVSGTEFCYHHSAVKTALAKAPQGKAPIEGFAPIPFVFPEDRASMQINFFLLLQAFNEQRIDQKTYRLMLSMLKAMAKNLGKTGSLVEPSNDAVSKETASKKAVSRKVASEEEEEDPFADLHGLPQEQFDAAVRERVDKLLDHCAAEGQKEAAANGNGKH
ncbi:MAG TPA: hypothetical protein VFT88_08555 [Acidobacteriaceae bacterium]|nr:hypothetical protein [Acidobacteriaceae bacterium]